MEARGNNKYHNHPHHSHRLTYPTNPNPHHFHTICKHHKSQHSKASVSKSNTTVDSSERSYSPQKGGKVSVVYSQPRPVTLQSRNKIIVGDKKKLFEKFTGIDINSKYSFNFTL